tara:strand:- start:43 stop:459 length:417 start_codon:yes stop_codon:yes gene_type:complete
MPGKEIKGRSKIATYRHGGRVGFSRGGGSAVWLRGRSGQTIKAPRGSEGFKQMQQYEKKIGRLTEGKKSHTDTSAKQKIAAQRKKEEIKNKEAREEWAEVSKLGKNLKTGAKIGGAGIGATVVAGKVKEKLKKNKDED